MTGDEERHQSLPFNHIEITCARRYTASTITQFWAPAIPAAIDIGVRLEYGIIGS